MKGKLYVISGPSGCGKSTVVHAVMAKYPNLRFSVSATTRPIRPGELDGEDYFFVTRERFDEMLRDGELLEHAEYVGNCYGTPERPLQEALDSGLDMLLDIEPQGAMQVRQKRPDAVLVFLAPPSMEALRARLFGRGDTSEELIAKRLEQARWELQQARNYDYIIINDAVENAAREFLAVITAEKCKTADRIRLLKEEH
ncbi:MAG: guanylate kinase [Oscillospiraceae bacterium]|nr:guanylate kinase [Oscillospiraceae bacterium]